MHNSNNSALSKDTIFGAKNHININSVFSSASILEDISVARAKEALSKKLVALKEAIQLSDKSINTAQTNNITETPKFHEAKPESIELSQSARETFARIGREGKKSITKRADRRGKSPFQTNIYQTTNKKSKKI